MTDSETYAVIFSIIVSLVFFLSVHPSYAGQLLPLPPAPAPAENPQTPEKIELGKKLFFDRRLSGDGTMSCATCHIPELAFTEGQDISMSYPTTKNWRNSPTLVNLAFESFLFHDGRAATLEEQALFPMMSSFEMNKNIDFAEEQIAQVPEYAEAFRKIFGGEVDRRKIAMAIASFERTLVSKGAPIDKHLKGDEAALSPEAQKGLEIFRGKGRCAECHFGVNFTDGKFWALQVPENPALRNDPRVITTVRFVAKVSGYTDYRKLTEDPGRFLVTRDWKDWKAFRTPTMREIPRTAPYMHNGVFATLEEVVEFFDKGGGEGNSVLKPLGLSKEEKSSLVAFLTQALHGEEFALRPPEIP